MLKRIVTYFLRFKYGLTILFLIVVGSVFMIGVWWGQRQTNYDVFNRSPPLDKQTQTLREQGLIFGDGLYFVGHDIEPGIYRTKGTDMSLYDCQWQRLSGFTAENHNIIVNYRDSQGKPNIVEIATTDKGFLSRGCGLWYRDLVPVLENPGEFGDGAFLVGQDIKPGTYQSSVPYGCYWERLNGLSRQWYHGRLLNQDTELIVASQQNIVTIEPDDKAFISSGCDKWVKHDSSDSS